MNEENMETKTIPIMTKEQLDIEAKLDIKDDRRTYYYNIYGKMEPDYESMAAYLLDEGILFVGQAGAKYDNGNECVGLFININDYFVPASDAEAVTCDELPKLYEMYKERKYDGVSQFVADKRGIPNIYWKDEGSSFRTRMKEKS